jgi:peptide-methionine (R)-S-oxide reductase
MSNCRRFLPAVFLMLVSPCLGLSRPALRTFANSAYSRPIYSSAASAVSFTMGNTPWNPFGRSKTTKCASSTDDSTEKADAPESKITPSASGEETKISGTVNPFRLAVLKLGITEPRFTSMLNYEDRKGDFKCAGCGSLLFTSDTKYDSKSGWPSFFASAQDDAVIYIREWDNRVECQCKSCGGHLGHVFGDGPTKASIPTKIMNTIPSTDPTYGPNRLPRFCLNGASLRFYPEE